MWFVNIKKAYKSTNHYFLATNAINAAMEPEQENTSDQL
jgi:hypothetical protein